MIEDILNRLDEIECSYCKHVGVKFDGEESLVCPVCGHKDYISLFEDEIDDEDSFDFDSIDVADLEVDSLDDIFDDIDFEDDIDDGDIFDKDALGSDMLELGLEESDFDFNLDDIDFLK